MTERHGASAVSNRAGEFARFILPMILVWVLPLAAVFVWLGLMTARESAAVVGDGPATVTVGRTEDAAVVPVTVKVQFAAPGKLRLRVGGLVTAVSADQAGAITSGRHLLSVDDLAIRAHVGASPIVHSVGPESRGADVERVSNLLVVTGYLEAAAGPAYTWDLRQAIDRWNHDGGFTANGVFDAGSTIFVNESNTALAGLDVVVGAQIAAGDNVGELVTGLTSVEFSPAADATLASLSGVPVVLQFGEEALSLLDRESAAANTELLAFLAGAASDGSATYTPGDGGGAYEGGRLMLAEAIEYATVPTNAVHIAPSGAMCVFVVATEGKYSATRLDDARPVGASGVTAVDLTLVGESVASDASSLPRGVLDTCE